MMVQDEETAALTSIHELLAPLEEEARGRIVSYLASRYGGVQATPRKGALKGDVPEPQVEFEDVHALYDAADPKTGPDRALVVAYWFQEHEEQSDLDSQAINNVLKDKGVGLKNITVAIRSLEERKPALVRQVGKKGSAKQGRKRHRVTTAGIKAVKRMLAGDSTDEE